MASIFTKIINREIPSYIISENDKYIAFLDVFPLVKGHTLIVPKKEVDKLWDLDKETYKGLMEFAYDVAHAIEKATKCNRVGVTVIGLEVPHAHVHLVPMNQMADINFMQEKKTFSDEEMEKIQQKIIENL